jgi:chorismate-pyruvate lyase
MLSAASFRSDRSPHTLVRVAAGLIPPNTFSRRILLPVTRSANHTTEAQLYSGSVARLASLFFDDLTKLGQFDPVAADELPADERSLLAHNDHMTVTLEEAFGSSVAVQTLAEWHDESSYARNSLLARQTDGRILQFGIMRIWLADLPAAMRDEITIERLPLGRVLIDHNMLREVELIALWRIAAGPALERNLKVKTDQTLYGRSAQILVGGRPTVQMLEIVSPSH